MIRYPCHCSEVDVPHNYLSERKAFDLAPLKMTAGTNIFYEIECAECGHKSEIPKEDWDDIAKQEELHAQRSRRVSLTRYPRIEPHSGELVKSKEHEAETLKRLGFHKAENGIDPNHDDETAYALGEKRKAREKRRADIRKKREVYIREGIIKRPKPALAKK